MPLILHDRVIASLSIDVIGKQREFSEEEIEFLKNLANQATVALQNAKRYEAANRGHSDARIQINGMVSALGTLQPSHVLQNIVDTNLATRAWRSLVLIIDQHGSIVDRAAAGYDYDLDEASKVRPNGITMQVFKSGEAEFISNTAEETKRLNKKMLGQGVRACACLPLKIDNRIIGVLWVHYREPYNFSETEIQRLQSFADYTALAYRKTLRETRNLECGYSHDFSSR